MWKGEPWEFETIMDLPGPNSYAIKTSGSKIICRNLRDIEHARASPPAPPPKPVITKAREPPMVPCLLERSNFPETRMGNAQGWPMCRSEDPKDVPPEPENTPPGDAQGWPPCPGRVHATFQLIVQRVPLNMKISDCIKQPAKYLNDDYCCKWQFYLIHFILIIDIGYEVKHCFSKEGRCWCGAIACTSGVHLLYYVHRWQAQIQSCSQ